MIPAVQIGSHIPYPIHPVVVKQITAPTVGTLLCSGRTVSNVYIIYSPHYPTIFTCITSGMGVYLSQDLGQNESDLSDNGRGT